MRSRRQVLAVSLLALICLALAIRLPLAWSQHAARAEFLEPLGVMREKINAHFYKEPDSLAMQQHAIQGMIEALDDPYTEYIPPQDRADFEKLIQGDYVGIGAQVRSDQGYLLIVSPMDGSPALNAGIEAGDRVLGIDGKSIYRMNTDAIIDELVGTPGTSVSLTVERQGTAADLPPNASPATDPAPRPELADQDIAQAPPATPEGSVRFDLELTRSRILAETILGIHRDGPNWDFLVDPQSRIAYIRISQFTDTTAPRIREYCQQLFLGDSPVAKALVLDLRFNSGGSLIAAIETADLFLTAGTIVSVKGRNAPTESIPARRSGTLPDFPMIVLVNEASASASEILAGALKDNDRAKVLGERTFGKGLVQGIHELPNGLGQLKITEQVYALPSGMIIQREDDSAAWGVDPSPGFYLPMDDRDDIAAIRIQRDAEVRRPDDAGTTGQWDDGDWILTHLQDRQLTGAVQALRHKLDTENWQPPAEDAPAGSLQLAEFRSEQLQYERLLRELERSANRLRALETTAASSDEDTIDLIPGDPNLVGGTLAITDPDGKPIATLFITGNTLERWLLDAPVERIISDDPADPPTSN